MFSRYMQLLFCSIFLAGCSTVGYYTHSIGGHLDLMGRSRPVEEVLVDPRTPAELRRKLELVVAIRDFATSRLGLPENDSYRRFADLEREAVAWSVVATPEFSVQPRQWCYPVIGCASYRGYFSRLMAELFADGLRQEGLDVAVEEVAAYSTLGWFDDPLPSTVVRWPEAQLAGLIFHELAHQQLYVSDDSAFNEAFATMVEQVGVERWLRSRGDSEGLKRWQDRKERETAFLRLLLQTRDRLKQLYAQSMPPEEMRERKAVEFENMKEGYADLKTGWGGYGGFDRWFGPGLNNARLASIATYERWVPAFLQLLEQSNGSLEEFFQECERMAGLPEARRRAQMETLLEQAGAP